MGDTPVQILTESLDRAQTTLMALAQDRSLCAIARSGQSFPAAKYAEGEVSALSEIRRAVRREDPADPRSWGELVERITRRWTDRSGGPADAGRDWAAYQAGGRDALDSFAEAIGASPAPGP